MGKKTQRDAKIRWYDGTATPFYLEFDLDSGDFSGPLGDPKTEEILVLDRGKATADMHYIEGPEDALMAPLDVTFTTVITDGALTTYILDWLAAMNDGLTTTPNSNTLVSTQQDTQRDGANNNPAFADSNKSTCNVEYLIELGGTDLGWTHKCAG